MAETDPTIPKPSLAEPAAVPASIPDAIPDKVVAEKGVPPKKERVSIALSEENLAALLGPHISRPKPPALAPVGEIQSTLALLSNVQEKHPSEPPPPAPPALPAPPAPAPQLSETLGSTLALLAAIKENRALMRSKPLPEPATIPPPEIVEVAPEPVEWASEPVEAAPLPVEASPKPVETAPEPVESAPLPVEAAPVPAPTPARRPRGTVYPTSAPPATPLPRWATSRPAPPSRLAAALDKIPGGRKSVLTLGMVIAIGGISAGLVVRNQRTAKASTAVMASPPVAAPAAESGNAFPLQLQAELQGNGSINLRWNSGSPLIAQAREGRLVVTETNQKAQTIAFSLDQLKGGHWSYQPGSERVEFRLEVVDQSGFIAEESALALVPPAAGKTENPPPQPIPSPQTPVVTPEQPASLSRPPARIFTPPAAQPVPEHAIVDTPPALPNVAVSALGANGQMPRAIAPPPPAPAPALTPTPTPAPAPRQIQVMDNLQAANLIKRVAPAYPPLAKAARLEGAVRFKATIGTNGSIRNLEVLSGPPMLRQAAIDAVRQWVYRPMLLNGQPLEVVTQIEVAFKLGQ